MSWLIPDPYGVPLPSPSNDTRWIPIRIAGTDLSASEEAKKTNKSAYRFAVGLALATAFMMLPPL
jgi:hypothetical protein